MFGCSRPDGFPNRLLNWFHCWSIVRTAARRPLGEASELKGVGVEDSPAGASRIVLWRIILQIPSYPLPISDFLII